MYVCICMYVHIYIYMYVYVYVCLYRQSQVRKPTGSEVELAECLLIIGTDCRVQVFAWSSIAQSVCQQAFSLLANMCLRPWVRILHSAAEDSLSPFDSNIACLCQSIEINNNKYICIYACIMFYILRHFSMIYVFYWYFSFILLCTVM